MASYSILVLPPSEPYGEWFGYARNDDHSPLLDGGDDPTPDRTRMLAGSAGACAEKVWDRVCALTRAEVQS